MFIMLRVGFFLSCWASMAHARKVQTAYEQWSGTRQPLNTFASLLVETNSAATFNPSSFTARVPRTLVTDKPLALRAAARTTPPNALLTELAEVAGVAFLGLLAFAFQGVGPSQEATAALSSSSMRCSTRTDGSLFFEPVGKPSIGLVVFYSGAKVAPASYAPLAQAVTDLDASMLVTQSPFNGSPPFQGGIYAFKPPPVSDILDDIKTSSNFPAFTVAGHSIGGLWAVEYCQELFSAGKWPKEPLHFAHVAVHGPDLAKFQDLPFASTTYFYASNDWTLLAALKKPADAPDGSEVESMEEYVARVASSQLPKDSNLVRIDGGNHAQYGSYGMPGKANGYFKDELEASADMPEERQRGIVAEGLVAPLRR